MASFLRYGTLVLALSLPAFASPLLEERARNNLVRCFDPTGTKPTDLASKSAATAFCSSLLSIPVVTSVVATTTPVTTATSTVTTTDATEVQTSISTATVLVVEKSTTTATVPAIVPNKRDAAVQPPACATQGAPSALSSACAYISVKPSTIFVTATAPTSTDINISIIHETTTTTTDTTALTTTTTTETSTVVTTASPAPVSSCPGGTVTTSNGKVFCVQHGTGILGSAPWYEFAPPTNSLLACIELCATTYAPRCIASDWLPSTGQCQVLYRTFGNFPIASWESAVLLS